MAHRKWGMLCPEGHGLLLEREEWTARGVAWCPQDTHGNNGRFWRLTEVKEGWWDTDHITPIDRSQAEFLAAREAERTAVWESRRPKMADTATKEKAPKAEKVGQACLCGCGGMTKGGRFLPGHDARWHGRVKQAMAAGKTQAEAEALASKGPLPASLAKPEPIKAAPKPKAAKTKPVDLTSKAEDGDTNGTSEGDTFEV